MTSFLLFQEFGTDNCKIELIEEYPCENLEQLIKKEGEYIKKTIDCVNKCVVGRSSKEYHEEHKDNIKEWKTQYYEANKDNIKEYKKQYYKANEEKMKEQKKEWYESKKEKLQEYKKQ